MSWPADYHMHTPLCRHAAGTPTEYAAQAKAVGLSEIGFSDHSPMPQDDFDDWRMRRDQLDNYVELVEQARKDHPNLIIRLGLEVDYLPGHESWIEELSRAHPWDYLIGSVHYISDSWAVDNPHQLSQWHQTTPEEVWETYCSRLTQAAASGLFDIIGHADLPKKFGIMPRKDPLSLFLPFLEAAQDKDVAVELNTGGLRKECREIYPCLSLCRLLQEYGLAITLGSDAHAIHEVGMHWPEAMRWARDAGLTHWRRLTRRQGEAVPLS